MDPSLSSELWEALHPLLAPSSRALCLPCLPCVWEVLSSVQVLSGELILPVALTLLQAGLVLLLRLNRPPLWRGAEAASEPGQEPLSLPVQAPDISL